MVDDILNDLGIEDNMWHRHKLTRSINNETSESFCINENNNFAEYLTIYPTGIPSGHTKIGTTEHPTIGRVLRSRRQLGVS